MYLILGEFMIKLFMIISGFFPAISQERELDLNLNMPVRINRLSKSSKSANTNLGFYQPSSMPIKARRGEREEKEADSHCRQSRY